MEDAKTLDAKLLALDETLKNNMTVARHREDELSKLMHSIAKLAQRHGHNRTWIQVAGRTVGFRLENFRMVGAWFRWAEIAPNQNGTLSIHWWIDREIDVRIDTQPCRENYACTFKTLERAMELEQVPCNGVTPFPKKD